MLPFMHAAMQYTIRHTWQQHGMEVMKASVVLTFTPWHELAANTLRTCICNWDASLAALCPHVEHLQRTQLLELGHITSGHPPSAGKS